MDANLDSDRIIAFLKAVGDRLHSPAEIVLLGGSALSLIGSSRPTLDLDLDPAQMRTHLALAQTALSDD